MLALTLLGWPRIAVIEEPWMGLAPASRTDVDNVFKLLQHRGTALFLISQEPTNSETFVVRANTRDKGDIEQLPSREKH
jgi:ABC-type multidrug transport system ATPase subunit